MLAACTGAKEGASWISTTRPSRSVITSRSSAGTARQACSGACATIPAGVSAAGGASGGAAPASDSRAGSAASRRRVERIPTSAAT